VHIRKEWLPNHRKSKLQFCDDSPFQVLEMINDNAYKVLLGEYGVSATFNVIDLIKSNPFKERGNDVDHAMNTKDPLHVLNRPITRSKIKALKEVLNGLVVQVSAKTKHGDLLEHQEEVLVHLFHVQEVPNPPLFWP
jgi:hypothetical protein